MKKHNESGFTLVELMIVIVIITVLVAIVVPRYSDALHGSMEGATRGNLGSIRKALGVYFSDMEGKFPDDVTTLIPRYLKAVPAAKLPGYHQDSSVVIYGAVPDDTGGWLYNNVLNSQNYGAAWVNCTHTDAKGNIWTSY